MKRQVLIPTPEPTPTLEPRLVDLWWEKRMMRRVGASLALLALVTLVGQQALVQLLFRFAPEAWNNPWAVWLLTDVPLYGFAVPLFYLCLRRVPVNRLPRQALGGGRFFQVFLIAIVLTEAGGLVGSLLMMLIGALSGEMPTNGLNEMLESGTMLGTVIFTVIVAPVGEELIFRKLLLDRVACYGDRAAILISGLAFGLFHGNFYQFFYAALLGMLFAYVYLRTGRLRYTIALHALINFDGAVVTDYVSRWSESALPWQTALVALYGLACFAAVIAGIVLLCKKGRLAPRAATYPIPSGRRASVFFWNAGTIAFVLLCCLLFALSFL